ncbi:MULTISPECIES: c-type cytochrome [Pseudomonas]|uniref:c-type cytochrome n=1 Tax=Pseudomonas TaxID=286 RepID=UPI0006D4718F|nr:MULTISPECIES: c-type cytochrome [Pseudomonas]MCE4067707.1 c-type cytochrome [Pseudomonas nitritireducens]MCE4076896.1 c-type cytochrome [Pseudomonas nitroreducens]OBY93521.1 cytochrome biogenesis protein ResB [Pseudomonas sp. AU11447]
MGRVVLWWVLLCASAQALAQSSEMMDRLAALEKDPAKREQAYAAAEERILLCSKCHGKDGNSKRDYIPNLAGQNPQYLFDAFEKYVDGQRTDFVMNQAAKLLTLNERVNIAYYFSQQAVLPRTEAVPDAAEIEQGAQRFATVCVTCHGAQALGHDGFPRIAGQPRPYLTHALQRYRDKDPSRAGSPMLAVAGLLSDDDIKALAAYVSQLQP